MPRLPAQIVRAEKEGRARSTHLQPWHTQARPRLVEAASEVGMLRRFLQLTGTLARTPLPKDSEGVHTDTRQVDSQCKRSSIQRPQQVARRNDDALPEDSNLARRATQRRMRLRFQAEQSSHVAANSSRQPNSELGDPMVAATVDTRVASHSATRNKFLFLLQHRLADVVKRSKLLTRHVA